MAETFATRAGFEPEAVARLGELGLIPPLDRLDDGHVPLARLIIELEKSGISLTRLAAVVSDGTLSLENIDRAFVRSARIRRGTFSGVAAELGMSDGFADDIRVALGVTEGGPAGMIRDDDAAVMQLLARMVDLGVGEDIVTDLFHVMADSLRKMARASSEMWAAGVQKPLLDSGMSFRDIAAAPSLNGEQLQAIGVDVVSTVWNRFLDDEIFSGTVAILERALEEAGVTRVASSGPPAIAFMDLTAFTTFTDREGDAVAAAGARDLRGILRRGIVTAGGTLVKMMGDGAMLHFEDAGAAVACARTRRSYSLRRLAAGSIRNRRRSGDREGCGLLRAHGQRGGAARRLRTTLGGARDRRPRNGNRTRRHRVRRDRHREPEGRHRSRARVLGIGIGELRQAGTVGSLVWAARRPDGLARERRGILRLMRDATRRLWKLQDRHPGDRLRLFAAVAEFTGDTPVLYPGSFVDVAPSFVFDNVTYVDSDRQAARFFTDAAGVDEIIDHHRLVPNAATWRFISADYRTELDVADRSVGLLVSLYAGFVSEHCTRYLRSEGWLLVNPSHGDVAMASITPDYSLAAVVDARSGRYTISERDLDGYLTPKRPTTITPELLHESGRAIAYTRSPFAYLFRRRTTDAE